MKKGLMFKDDLTKGIKRKLDEALAEINSLKMAAKKRKSKSLDKLVSAIGDLVATKGPFDKMKRMIQKMVFQLQGEQKDALATMQDIRVAAAATITLMAYRQEFIGENGIPNIGKWHMYWSFGKSMLLIFAVVIATFWCWTVSFEASMLNSKIKDTFKRLENSILPRYSPGKRLPVLHPTQSLVPP